jgi:hypothetical protein
LLIALNRAGVLGGDDSETTTETKPTTGLFSQINRPNGQRVYFDGETMYVRAARPPLVHVANLDEPLSNVSMKGRVSWVSGASDYGMSFVCRYADSQNYYLLGVLSGRRYNIARYRDGRIISLTGGIQRSTAIDEDTNDVTARCVGDDPTTLSLEVNGRPVATKQDPDGIESGNVGVRAGSNESFVVFRFDEFELAYL